VKIEPLAYCVIGEEDRGKEGKERMFLKTTKKCMKVIIKL
jgi:hypothetical protein